MINISWYFHYKLQNKNLTHIFVLLRENMKTNLYISSFWIKKCIKTLKAKVNVNLRENVPNFQTRYVIKKPWSILQPFIKIKTYYHNHLLLK